jgi:hypothetical protein
MGAGALHGYHITILKWECNQKLLVSSKGSRVAVALHILKFNRHIPFSGGAALPRAAPAPHAPLFFEKHIELQQPPTLGTNERRVELSSDCTTIALSVEYQFEIQPTLFRLIFRPTASRSGHAYAPKQEKTG